MLRTMQVRPGTKKVAGVRRPRGAHRSTCAPTWPSTGARSVRHTPCTPIDCAGMRARRPLPPPAPVTASGGVRRSLAWR